MCIIGFMTQSKGWGARSLFLIFFSFMSRNCNLFQHDNKPLDSYLFTFCRPQLLIKWYGFYPKTTKKKKKRIEGSEKRQGCVNAPGK